MKTLLILALVTTLTVSAIADQTSAKINYFQAKCYPGKIVYGQNELRIKKDGSMILKIGKIKLNAAIYFGFPAGEYVRFSSKTKNCSNFKYNYSGKGEWTFSSLLTSTKTSEKAKVNITIKQDGQLVKINQSWTGIGNLKNKPSKMICALTSKELIKTNSSLEINTGNASKIFQLTEHPDKTAQSYFQGRFKLAKCKLNSKYDNLLLSTDSKNTMLNVIDYFGKNKRTEISLSGIKSPISFSLDFGFNKTAELNQK